MIKMLPYVLQQYVPFDSPSKMMPLVLHPQRQDEMDYSLPGEWVCLSLQSRFLCKNLHSVVRENCLGGTEDRKPPKDIYVLVPRTCGYVAFLYKRDFAV